MVAMQYTATIAGGLKVEELGFGMTAPSEGHAALSAGSTFRPRASATPLP